MLGARSSQAVAEIRGCLGACGNGCAIGAAPDSPMPASLARRPVRRRWIGLLAAYVGNPGLP